MRKNIITICLVVVLIFTSVLFSADKEKLTQEKLTLEQRVLALESKMEMIEETIKALQPKPKPATVRPSVKNVIPNAMKKNEQKELTNTETQREQEIQKTMEGMRYTREQAIVYLTMKEKRRIERMQKTGKAQRLARWRRNNPDIIGKPETVERHLKKYPERRPRNYVDY